MRRGTRAMLAAGAATAALAFAGCGDEEGPQIPEDQSVALRNQLRDLKQQLDDPENGCSDAQQQTLPAIDAQVAELPQDLDEDVRSTVEDAVARLHELVEEECTGVEDEEEQEDTQTEEPTETLPPEPTETEEEETETEEEPPPTQTEPEPEPEIPPAPDGGGVPGPPGQEKKKEKGKDG